MGRVLRPHALRGEVRASAFSASALNLQPGRTVYLLGTPRKIVRARADREAWILKLDGLDDRNAVEALRGELLEAPDNEVERDDEDSYFVHELIGLRVETLDGEELGTLTDVMQPGANDVYVVTDATGNELLVPAIGEVVEEHRPGGGRNPRSAAGRVRGRDPEGSGAASGDIDTADMAGPVPCITPLAQSVDESVYPIESVYSRYYTGRRAGLVAGETNAPGTAVKNCVEGDLTCPRLKRCSS